MTINGQENININTQNTELGRELSHFYRFREVI